MAAARKKGFRGHTTFNEAEYKLMEDRMKSLLTYDKNDTNQKTVDLNPIPIIEKIEKINNNIVELKPIIDKDNTPLILRIFNNIFKKNNGITDHTGSR